MNLPWVSRELYDLAVADAERWRTHHAELLAVHMALLKPPLAPTPVAPDTVAERKRSAIAERIEEVSDGDRKLARHFRGLVSRLRKEGQSDGDILGQITMVAAEP